MLFGFFMDMQNLFFVFITDDSISLSKQLKDEQEYNNDQIVILNEVIDVMRAVVALITKKMKEIQAKGNDDEQQEEKNYLIDKSLILEAWAKYRPTSIPQTAFEKQ